MNKPLGHIKAATLDSPRLQRVLQLLIDGRPRTTRQIVRQAKVMAVNAAVAELRHHGAEITCTKKACPNGGGWRFYYQLKKAPSA
jgi:hypothetical protein